MVIRPFILGKWLTDPRTPIQGPTSHYGILEKWSYITYIKSSRITTNLCACCGVNWCWNFNRKFSVYNFDSVKDRPNVAEIKVNWLFSKMSCFLPLWLNHDHVTGLHIRVIPTFNHKQGNSIFISKCYLKRTQKARLENMKFGSQIITNFAS